MTVTEANHSDVDTSPVLLSEILDLSALRAEIVQGFVVVRAHPEDATLRILTYAKVTQILGRWYEVTKTCRGLIVRSAISVLSDAVVQARPWRKFFTLHQITGGWALSDEESETSLEAVELDFDALAEVTDKVDGSMGILYRAPDGRAAFATKGSFDSIQARYFTAWMRREPRFSEACEMLLGDFPESTHIFELVGPGNQVVLHYENDDIVYLGSVNLRTGAYASSHEQRIEAISGNTRRGSWTRSTCAV